MKFKLIVLALLVGAASTVASAAGGRKGYGNKTVAQRQAWCQRHGGQWAQGHCQHGKGGQGQARKGSHKGREGRGGCRGGVCPRRQGAAVAAAGVAVAGKPAYVSLAAAVQNRDVAAVEQLIGQEGVEIEGKGDVTPLMLAVQDEVPNNKIITLLMSNGAEVNAQDSAGWTPLMYAAEAGNLFAVRLLLQQGATRTTKNKAGKTAFDIAFEEGEKDVVNELTEVVAG